jgi:hypothetical protein
MIKIILRPDQAAVAAKVLDLDDRCAVHLQPVAPLHDHGALVGELVEAEVAKLGAALHAIQIDVGKLQPTGIDANQLEGWACDMGFRPDPLRDTTHERRLARTELSDEENDVARPEPLAKPEARPLGLRR